jgi:hypothetical protein
MSAQKTKKTTKEKLDAELEIIRNLEVALYEPYLPFYSVEQLEGDLLHSRLYAAQLWGDLATEAPEADKAWIAAESALLQNDLSLSWRRLSDAERDYLLKERGRLRAAVEAARAARAAPAGGEQ